MRDGETDRTETGDPRADADGGARPDEGADGSRSGRWTGRGILSALRDALEDALGDARERGDLSGDRARDIVGRAAERAREAAGDARDRFDFVPRGEFDTLARRVAELERRMRDPSGTTAPGWGADDRPPGAGS